VIPFSSITATATAEPEVVNQRGMEEEINNSIVPDLDTEAPPPIGEAVSKPIWLQTSQKNSPVRVIMQEEKG
jgi:hypothetical protein